MKVKIKAVDFDKVNESNLNRQVLFSSFDVGKLKTIAAKNALNSLKSVADFELINEKISEKNIDKIFSDCSIILDCSDNYAVRSAINRHCLKFGKIWVYSAAFASECMLSTINCSNKSNPCFECFTQKPKTDLKCGSSTPITSVSFIASMQVQELFNISKENPSFEGKLLYANLQTGEFFAKQLNKKKNCVCN